MEKIKGVLWLEARKVGDANLQEDFSCDPRVARFFQEGFVTSERPLTEPVVICAVTEEEWRRYAKYWEDNTPPEQSFSVHEDPVGPFPH